jgi:chorismate-pyruvate lyase
MKLFSIFIFIFSIFCGSANSKNSEDESSRKYTQAQLEAYAILQTLNANLLGSKSATRVLQTWCEDHQMADNPVIIAIRDTSLNKEASQEVRNILNAKSRDLISYRRVKLYCGMHVLSEADNWYLPERLTPEMNDLLANTDTPFGVAVRQLNFYRKTEKVELLWYPLPKNWEQEKKMLTGGGSELVIPDHVLQHQTLLVSDKNVPFSFVIENYTNKIYAFPRNSFGR